MVNFFSAAAFDGMHLVPAKCIFPKGAIMGATYCKNEIALLHSSL
jgi:hypothetical protein